MNDNIAAMARGLAERKSFSWTKTDKRKYKRIVKKILKKARKGRYNLTLQWFISDWSRVFKQLKEDGFEVEHCSDYVAISWNEKAPMSKLVFPLKRTET